MRTSLTSCLLALSLLCSGTCYSADTPSKPPSCDEVLDSANRYIGDLEKQVGAQSALILTQKDHIAAIKPSDPAFYERPLFWYIMGMVTTGYVYGQTHK